MSLVTLSLISHEKIQGGDFRGARSGGAPPQAGGSAGAVGRLVEQQLLQRWTRLPDFPAVLKLSESRFPMPLIPSPPLHGRRPYRLLPHAVQDRIIMQDVEKFPKDMQRCYAPSRRVGPKPRYTRGVLAKYAKLCTSASLGAVTDLGL